VSAPHTDTGWEGPGEEPTAWGGAPVRNDAMAKATGTARYTADVPATGAWHIALVRCPHPGARITRIDVADAREAPGVRAVLTAADLPDDRAGRRVRDQPLLAGEVALYSGEPVAAVLAETRQQAETAAALVEVDYEPIEGVFDPLVALQSGSPLVHRAPWEYPGAVVRPEDGPNLQSVVTDGDPGSTARALAGAAHRVTATYRTPAGHQGYLEPQAWAAELDEAGRLRIRGTTKSPYRLREQAAATLGTDPEQIEVEPALLGGDFGGKGAVVDAILCAAICRVVGHPVQLVLRSSEDLTATDARHPSVVTVSLGCDQSGRLVALDFDAVFDGGAYAAAKPIPSVNLHGAIEAAVGYRFGNFALRSRVAYTHTVPKGHMRAPGAPQTVFAIESALDELAGVAGMDPAELRRRNLLRPGESDAYGHSWPDARGVDVLEAALAAAGGEPAAGAPASWALGSGMAFYCRPTPPPPATALSLRQLADGTFQVGVPIPETGTGSHSVVADYLAAALGVDPGAVSVHQLPTSALGFDPGVGASRVTAGMTAAVERLAEEWRARPPGTDALAVEVPAGDEGPALTCCAQVARVGVDTETGEMRILELISAVDVAEVMRPPSHQLQIDGGAVMGIGFARFEDLQEEDGQVWASTLGEFKLPVAADVPPLRTVIVPGGKGVGPANIKAVGELTNVPVAAAVANAVADATGIRVRDLPVSAERIYWLLHPDQGSDANGGTV
jgi:putative selenate reductase molybdopterin-binding subunit